MKSKHNFIALHQFATQNRQLDAIFTFKMDLLENDDITLITDYLPTVHDVLKAIKFLIEDKRFGSLYHTGVQKFLPVIATHIIALWTKANIPTVSTKIVLNLIKQKRNVYKKSVLNLKRSSGSSSSSITTPSSSRSSTPLNIDVEMLYDLFDITSCKCFRLLTNIKDLQKYNCKCMQKNKIPSNAIRF